MPPTETASFKEQEAGTLCEYFWSPAIKNTNNFIRLSPALIEFVVKPKKLKVILVSVESNVNLFNCLKDNCKFLFFSILISTPFFEVNGSVDSNFLIVNNCLNLNIRILCSKTIFWLWTSPSKIQIISASLFASVIGTVQTAFPFG